MPNVQPMLRTERLVLAPLSDDHLEAELELDADPEVLRYLYPRARTREEVLASHRTRLESAEQNPGLGFWFGFVDGEPVGWWLLRPPHGPDQPPAPGEAELGYRLLRRHWRRGFASEGSRALIRYGFEQMGLRRIFAQTMAVNAGSRATMESVGLEFVRAYPSAAEDQDVAGHEQGEVEYAISRECYETPPA